MKSIKKVYDHYLETKQGPHEGFLEWYLKRHAGFWTKLIIALVLWSIWIWLWFNPLGYIYFFWLILILAVLTGLVQLLAFIKNRKKCD